MISRGCIDIAEVYDDGADVTHINSKRLTSATGAKRTCLPRCERPCESLAASLTPPLRLSSSLSYRNEDMNRDESGKERDRDGKRDGGRGRKNERERERKRAGFLSWTEGSWKLQKAAVKCETKKGRTNRAMGKAKLGPPARNEGK